MQNTVKLMIGTNQYVLSQMLDGKFNQVVWASDDLETVAHYYEGAAVEIAVELVTSEQHHYIRDCSSISSYENGYRWGCAEMKYPDGAMWYSFSSEYLRDHLIGIREIYPDLTKWKDED